MVEKTIDFKNARSGAVLYDFVKFCVNNPDLRFWQALRAWTRVNFILTSAHPISDIERGLGSESGLRDTFYWENKND